MLTSGLFAARVFSDFRFVLPRLLQKGVTNGARGKECGLLACFPRTFRGFLFERR
jgi:hypothetical protein